jgi:2-succinyl-5-enolpyruvyl-6-hydroxy-3-cyclohexene-1-carboxylate synthase
MQTWEKALDTVHRCLRAGVAEFVLCAGARNAALIEVLARAEAAGKARLWRHFEERSAGFFALGRTMDTGRPCAVVTTSGTACAELLPAVIEACYQARPLVALTADRPAAYRGSGAPQTIVQPGMFGMHAFAGEIGHWDGRGPFHWNVEFDETFVPQPVEFPAGSGDAFAPVKERLDVAALARWLREDHEPGIVVWIGGLEPGDQEEVYHFCRDFGAPVMADAASGLREMLRGLALHDGDRVLKACPPGKILRLGELPAGRFWRDLEDLPAVSVWSVCRSGLPGLARASQVTCGSVHRVLKAIGEVEPAGDALGLLDGASARAAHIGELLERHPDSEPALVRALSHYACMGGGVFLGNSLPVREWNLFAQWTRPVRQVRANRGANGIDGQTSTWLGWSADRSGAWALLGDLTTLYDLAAPFVMDQVVTGGRVLAIINNHGGGIFRRLPRLDALGARAIECMTNPHRADLAGFATLWGLGHLQVRTADDLDAFVHGGGPVVLEIIPDALQTRRFWEDWDRLTERGPRTGAGGMASGGGNIRVAE